MRTQVRCRARLPPSCSTSSWLLWYCYKQRCAKRDYIPNAEKRRQCTRERSLTEPALDRSRTNEGAGQQGQWPPWYTVRPMQSLIRKRHTVPPNISRNAITRPRAQHPPHTFRGGTSFRLLHMGGGCGALASIPAHGGRQDRGPAGAGCNTALQLSAPKVDLLDSGGYTFALIPSSPRLRGVATHPRRRAARVY